jgi:cytochrome c oxidase cbb3-type subunit 4
MIVEWLVSLIHPVWTVLVFIIFIGIVVWAYSSRRKDEFDAAARDPIEDDDSIESTKDKHDV